MRVHLQKMVSPSLKQPHNKALHPTAYSSVRCSSFLRFRRRVSLSLCGRARRCRSQRSGKLKFMDEQKEKKHKPSCLSTQFDGCGTGCCLGAVSAPFLFFLLLELQYRFIGDFDAEGVPFFTILSVPVGAVAGAILWPIIVRVGGIVIEAIKRRSK